jgi:hypothetical protein
MRDREAKVQAKSGIIVRLIFAVIAGAFASAGTTAAAQPSATAQTGSPASAVAKYSGCVMRLEADKDTLVINDATVCAKLTGKFVAADIAGHEVDLTGVLTAGTRTVPAAIGVSGVSNVGKSCSSTCSLLPPRTRGLGKGGELPGKEGGTPGVAPPH